MNMTFANTVFPKQPEAHTTFIEANNSAHQMDYFLVDWSTWTFTCDACSTNLVGMGSDHKMVMMRLEVGKAQQRQPKKKATRVQWNVVDVSKYKDGLVRSSCCQHLAWRRPGGDMQTSQKRNAGSICQCTGGERPKQEEWMGK